MDVSYLNDGITSSIHHVVNIKLWTLLWAY